MSGLKPSAKISQSPVTAPSRIGTNTTLKPSCSMPIRFHEPWKMMNAPSAYFAGRLRPEWNSRSFGAQCAGKPINGFL